MADERVNDLDQELFSEPIESLVQPSIAETELTYPPFWLNCFWVSKEELASFEMRSKTLQSATSVLASALNFALLAASLFAT